MVISSPSSSVKKVAVLIVHGRLALPLLVRQQLLSSRHGLRCNHVERAAVLLELHVLLPGLVRAAAEVWRGAGGLLGWSTCTRCACHKALSRTRASAHSMHPCLRSSSSTSSGGTSSGGSSDGGSSASMPAAATPAAAAAEAATAAAAALLPMLRPLTA